jgi:hypothetical protein
MPNEIDRSSGDSIGADCDLVGGAATRQNQETDEYGSHWQLHTLLIRLSLTGATKEWIVNARAALFR